VHGAAVLQAATRSSRRICERSARVRPARAEEREHALAAKLTEVCPVDIFATGGEGGTLTINEENLDECVLCRLCIDAAPRAPSRS
jgi:NAD-dependent dihydropyrimidine dehydrogenase PreA subunit